MTFATLPTRGPTDLGAAISDIRAPVTNELSAVSVESIKTRLIEIGTAVGVDTGVTGSTALRAVVNTLTTAAGVHNIAATTAPAVGDDSADGYATGSIWFDTVGVAVYECVSPAVGAAIWIQILTLGGDAPEDLQSGASNGGASAVPARLDHRHALPLSLIESLANTAGALNLTGADVDVQALLIDGYNIENLIAYPPHVTASGALALAAAHLGGVVFATHATANAFTLPDLSAEAVNNQTLMLTIEPEAAACVVTITPASGVSINRAAATTPYVNPAGTRLCLISRDGLNWRTGGV